MQIEQLFELSSQYLDKWESEGDDALNDEQHTLLAFCFMDSHVQDGGFVHLIASGYGEYVLMNPIADSLRRWRIKSTPKILEKARALYAKYGEQIEQLAESGSEIDALRQQFNDFEELDADYYDCAEQDWQIACEYVAAHREKFVQAA